MTGKTMIAPSQIGDFMRNEHLTRQLDILPLEALGEPITIIGAGAVGSWTTLALAKMGFSNLTVWDFDQVDIVNLNSQLYRRKDIGTPKVLALKSIVEDFTDIPIKTVACPYEVGIFPGIVIAAVDSMAVRKRIWRNHREVSPFTRAIIDPRMGAEIALCYVSFPMGGASITRYEKTLHSDAEGVQEPCTRKATAYCALGMAALVATQVKNLVTKADAPWSIQWAIPQGDMITYSDAKPTAYP